MRKTMDKFEEMIKYSNAILWDCIINGPSLRELEHQILLMKIKELEDKGVFHATDK